MPYEIPTTHAGLRSECAAATRRGLTVRQYRAHRLAGECYCPSCMRWLAEGCFRKDSSKASGLTGICSECTSVSRRRATPEQRRERAERRAVLKADREARREAKRLEYLRRQEEAAVQYQPARPVSDKPPVLPYAFRAFSHRGTLSEALRIDAGGAGQ